MIWPARISNQKKKSFLFQSLWSNREREKKKEGHKERRGSKGFGVSYCVNVSVTMRAYMCWPASSSSVSHLLGEFTDDADEGPILVPHLADIRSEHLDGFMGFLFIFFLERKKEKHKKKQSN